MLRTVHPSPGRLCSRLLLLWLLPLVTPSPLAAPALGISSNVQRINQTLKQAHSNSSSDNAHRVPSQGAVQQLLSQNAARASICPSIQRSLSAPGCPCTLYASARQSSGADQQQGMITSADAAVRPLMSDAVNGKRNVCPAGYRCSPSAAADMISAGWEATAVVGASGLGNISKLVASPGAFGLEAATTGLCVACQLGESWLIKSAQGPPILPTHRGSSYLLSPSS